MYKVLYNKITETFPNQDEAERFINAALKLESVKKIELFRDDKIIRRLIIHRLDYAEAQVFS